MAVKHDLGAAGGPLAAFAAMGLFWGGFAALVPALKARAGLGDEAFGLAMLVSTCGAVLAMWAAPRAEARLGRAALPVLSLLMVSTFLLPGLSRGWWSFALAMTAAGAAAGLLDVVMNAQVAALEAARRRPLMNLAHGTYSIVYAAAAVLTGLAREAGASPQPVFTGLAAAALGCVALTLAAPRVRHPDSGSGAVPPLPGALVIAAGLVVLIGFLTEQAAEGWSALHLERNLGAGAAAGAIGPALLGATMGAGRLFGQGLARHVAPTGLLCGGALVAAAGALLAALAPTLALAYAGFAALGLGAALLVPMGFAFVAARVAPEARAAAIARLSMIGYLGFFLGPPMMGIVSGAVGLAAAFAVVALVLCLVPLALVPWMRRSARALA